MRRLLQTLCLAVLCQFAVAAPSVQSFSPEGVVKQVRQVTARFGTQMVAFGDLRAPDPFTVDCAPQGKGRWIDGSTWSYDFEQDLPGAVACRFRLRDDLRDLAGQALGGARSFELSTGGPRVIQSLPREGSGGIDEHQVFVLGLDAVPREDSIAAHAWCRADGVNEKIPVRLLAGAERERYLALRRDFVDRYLTVYFKARGAVWRAKLPLHSRIKDELPVAVLQCQRTLPAGSDVALVWGAGIAAANGIATDEDYALAFHTRPDFSATFSCERLHAKGGCIPFLPLRLNFSAPVATARALGAWIEAPGGKRYPASLARGEAKPDFVNQLQFKGPFPERAQLALHLPAGLVDDADRPLVNAARFPMAVRMDEQPPLVKFAAPFGIIEAKGDRLLPVTVRNVEAALAGRMQTAGASVRLGAGQDEQVIEWLKRLHGYGDGWTVADQYRKDLLEPLLGNDAKARRLRLPKPNGRRAFEVVGIPLRETGFFVVELASPRLGAGLEKPGATAYVRSAALVTNMAAHFKHGAQSSLVWVTSLDKGQPVGGAEVGVRDCHGFLLWSGTTDAQGVAHIAAELEASRCNGNQSYYISARHGGDFTFTLSDWNRGIETWRFNLPTGSPFEDTRLASTVFDRTLLRAGETVHMKHFLRRHTGEGLALVGATDRPPREQSGWLREDTEAKDGDALPHRAWLVHQGSGEKVEQVLQWDAAGNAVGEWAIPAGAKLGMYQVMIGSRVSGEFRVEQFRVPSMRAVLSGPRQPAVAANELTLDAQLSYLSGGPAGGAPVTLRTMAVERGVSFPNYEDFTFGAGDVKVGTVRQGAAFDDDEDEGSGEGEGAGTSETPRTRQLVLDRAGGARITVDQLPHGDEGRALLAELSYQDANGETQTVSTRVPLWPSQYVAGIKPDGWLQSRERLKFQVAVLDVTGKPVANAPVAVDLFKRSTVSHRRRLVGGFYAYENATQVERVGPACAGSTNAQGLLLCELKTPASGSLVLRARTEDPSGRAAVTKHDIWVAGREEGWFDVTDNDRIDLLPEKKRYEPGEQARFQLRSPFREATALVTVEREGIIDTYVRHVSGKDPVISVPVKANYAPNVFVSAMLVRGRVASVAPTALVDLGKPAYKLGIAAIKVGWAAHELKVRVEPDKPVYKVREQASVHVRVTRADGSAAPGAEVALAAVDAGLLELMPNDSWDLLASMMNPRSLDVSTSTAQMQVVGKRHFGRKAVPHGGGGGRSQARELFETLLLWKGRVALDANGEATVRVPLNDSLTSFRVVAIASAGAGLFGTGQTEIRSTQDLMLMSGLPALVREGDRLHAGFTLRNASSAAMQVTFGASLAADQGKPRALPPQTISLAPGAAQEAGWDVTVPQAAVLRWDVEAAAGGARDHLRASQKVEAAVPTRTLQATLLQLDGPQSMKVERPADALPGHGGVMTTFTAKLGSDLPGVREWMAAYPYSCLEQRVSQAVALREPNRWGQVTASLPSYLDSDGLAKYFVSMDEGSDTLTAYLLSVADEAGYQIPAALRERMEAGLQGFVSGRITRGSGLATGELAVRKLAALEALSRGHPVRPDLLESFQLAPTLWPTSAVIDWYLILQRSPGIPARSERLRQAETILRARLNLQGTTMGFSTERSDDWWWLMVSPDVNANRLLLAMLDNPGWKPDMGRLARGTLGRQQHGRWRTTIANAWGVLALAKFSDRFEAEPVTGKNIATLGGQAWSGAVPAKVVQAWPERASELSLRHEGTGKPWATVQSLAAIPLAAPLSSGYHITRTVTPVEQQSKGAWKRGDIYRVHLDLDAQSDMTWVVVDDPVPAGASILGSGLARDSQAATSGERQRGWVQPDFIERKADAFRAYYGFVPKGKWSIEYTVRLNNEGRFNLPPTRVEAMYSPEMFGEVPNAPVEVTR